ncbi:type I-E CRISPR-associated protein Cas7/Cse4/CasC [Microbispora sp. CA-135349]|uniref:type I-E CRISPR-associated protein Cas7/Cse4/CasC n=1 Tax=Microbispora sp. CA-135349 TaxID=3239953 RepID=UPI003D89DF37
MKAATKDLPVADRLKSGHPMGVALFGRMAADIPSLNVDAATQVAHANSTHPVEIESDCYTAVDDENEADESGAGVIGNVGSNAATLYRYATVGVHQLADNLGSLEAAIEAVGRFAEAFALSMPTGRINSFAHRTRPSLVAVVVRDDQPVNFVSAFERPIRDTDHIDGTPPPPPPTWHRSTSAGGGSATSLVTGEIVSGCGRGRRGRCRRRRGGCGDTSPWWEMLPWPRRSFTTWRSAPPASSQEAWAWRRSCILTLNFRPEAARAGRQIWSRNQRRGM